MDKGKGGTNCRFPFQAFVRLVELSMKRQLKNIYIMQTIRQMVAHYRLKRTGNYQIVNPKSDRGGLLQVVVYERFKLQAFNQENVGGRCQLTRGGRTWRGMTVYGYKIRSCIIFTRHFSFSDLQLIPELKKNIKKGEEFVLGK